MTEKRVYECEECGETFTNGKVKSNHVRWKHRDNYSKAGREKLRKTANKTNERMYGKWIEDSVNCHICGKKIEVKYRKGKKKKKYFCSISCANTRTHSKETKEKIRKSTSISIKEKWATDKVYANKCLASITNSKRFTSKREVEIREYFIKTYPQDEWAFGLGLVLENGTCSRDLYSDKLRVCFEYDGIWHFEDIKGQLKKKQEKDSDLEKWCIRNDYRLVRIDEKEKLSLKEIEELIYNRDDEVIKIGERY